MTGLRDEEQWVKACVEGALPGVEVKQHDDNSRGSMHDLDLIRGGWRFGAVEVTAAADGESIALWKLMYRPGQRWIERDLAGGWAVALLPSARAKRLRSELPILLAELERRGVREVPRYRHSTDRFSAWLGELGVVHAHQAGTDSPGSIYVNIELPLERSGGWVADTGDALAEWLSGWMLEPHEADNLRKLERSGAAERHLFVILPGFTTAPFAAAELLMRPEAPLPTVPPTLPPAVTHAWVMSTWSAPHGFRWSPDDGWSRFSKSFEVADSA
ncbi:hypothetical protein [Micromonospora cremea]|uniref:Uncharacterized protein n=1 Tax=Micromonospora cremea TaxID=709881 RepID=A0A1N5YY77_9ACTN|nr:hypothetical protein [Micromonospora cremea]SIN14464.1 hypothetical protein SAMN04489832_3413 [Micromonospora cremea]